MRLNYFFDVGDPLFQVIEENIKRSEGWIAVLEPFHWCFADLEALEYAESCIVSKSITFNHSDSILNATQQPLEKRQI
jgi:hypothetical protein